ncbi:Alpha N-terminal protein methyltransferase 1B [Phytophthora pseudosyringae]|uniref:Alpha N-terminal protein methyltransferase 1B n=1 Tax=Phytophthora pseudosyringae TaxID=221518 RepID=A0A8T1W6R8_9STRA|nr:Alpha N-terminal protein methyltransferase 1B [Phytophthora pseudosyringae]
MAPDSDSEAVSLRLPRSRRSCSPVDWEELRAVATAVQRALDASSEVAPHDEYESVFAMWQAELGDAPNGPDEGESAAVETAQELAWYASALEYWDDEAKCPLTDDGVLGGFAHVSGVDIRESKRFLKHVRDAVRPEWGCHAAADCGAGIGRVSKLLLLPMFDRVDLVEQSPRLLRGVLQYMGEDEALRARVRDLYCMGLQDFDPAPASYDLIWMQWVLVHLTDLDLVRYLKRCKKALTANGFIVIKENIFQTAEPYDLDRQDSSITRSAVYYKSIFQQAGLTLLAERRQRHFPEELYPVKMYALA